MMKHVVLTLMILVPLMAAAQEKGPSPTQNETLLAVDTVQPAGSPAQAQKNNGSDQSSKQSSKPKPEIPSSMVGYVDNPIVQSEIRIRFDDAFEDQFPDRDEFLYAKCGCYKLLLPIVPQSYDPHAPGPGTGIPKAINYQQLYFNVEYAPFRRFSVFSEVPLRWLQPQGFFTVTGIGLIPPGATAFGNQSGISDVTAGFKFAAVASESTYVTFQFKSYFPSGDSSKGLGTNHFSVEPSILAYHKFSDKWRLEGQVGDWHPIGGSAGAPTAGSEGFAGDIFFYGIGPSYKLYTGNNFSITPVVELFGWHVISGFQTDPNAPQNAADEVGGLNIVNLKAGVRTGIGLHNSFYVGFGQAVTHDDWYKHIIRLEYRYAF